MPQTYHAGPDDFKMGAAITKTFSGMLYSIGGRDVGKFINKMVKGVRYTEGHAKSMAYFAPGGGAAFTPAVSRAAALHIRQGLMDPNKEVLAFGQMLPKLSDRHPYAEAKRNSGFFRHGGEKVGLLTGTMAHAVGVITRSLGNGKSVRTIGIKPSYYANTGWRVETEEDKPPKLVPTGEPVNVGAYAKRFEFGFRKGRVDQPARPFMGWGITQFLSLHFSGWADAVKDTIALTNIKYANLADGEVSSSLGESMGMEGAIQYSGDDFTRVAFKSGTRLADAAEDLIQYVKDLKESYASINKRKLVVDPVGYRKALKETYVKKVREQVAGMGLSPDNAVIVMDAVLKEVEGTAKGISWDDED